MTCYPFGLTIKCSCDTRGRPLQCLPVLDYSVGLNVGGGAGAHTGMAHGEGGDHDIWGDLHEEETDFRGIREQETEVILAFTLLITILLTFIGFIIHRCERLSYKRKCKGCPEPPQYLVTQVSVCVQTDVEAGFHDPFPLLSHLNTLQIDSGPADVTTSPPTTKTSYTGGSSGQSLPYIYPDITPQDPDNMDGYKYRASQDHLDQQME